MNMSSVSKLCSLLVFILIAPTSVCCRTPEPVAPRPVVDLEPQDAFRFPLENPDDRELWLLPGDDKIVLAATADQSAAVRIRLMVVDVRGIVICDTTQKVQLWKARVEPVELPILNRYTIEPRGKRIFTVRARVLSQDVANEIRFRLEIAGLTVSRPRRDASPQPPTSVSELSEH